MVGTYHNGSSVHYANHQQTSSNSTDARQISCNAPTEERLRATVAEATMSSVAVGMEARPSNAATPRELTQNPLKKIWMPLPCKNGLPDKRICQRMGAYNDYRRV